MRSDAGAKTKPFGPGVDGAASTMSLCVEEVVLLTLPLNFSISLVVKGVFLSTGFKQTLWLLMVARRHNKSRTFILRRSIELHKLSVYAKDFTDPEVWRQVFPGPFTPPPIFQRVRACDIIIGSTSKLLASLLLVAMPSCS